MLRLITDHGSLLVARGPDLLVGTIVAGWDGWRGNLYRLPVLPEFRRQGVGRQLVRGAEHNLRARGCTRITALVRRDDPDAVAFWEAVGYARLPRMTRYVTTLPTSPVSPGR